MQAGAADLRLETAKKTKYEQASEVIWRRAASRRISSSAAGARRANNAQCTHQVILGQKLQCTFGSSYTVLGGGFKKAKKCNIPGGVLISFS